MKASQLEHTARTHTLFPVFEVWTHYNVVLQTLSVAVAVNLYMAINRSATQITAPSALDGMCPVARKSHFLEAKCTQELTISETLPSYTQKEIPQYKP
jgi:hypothetical protein